MVFFLRWVWNNHFNLPSLPPPATFKDQSILITGASGGLGLETAIHFINLGASSVTITARTLAKGEAAKATIEARTKTAGTGILKIMILNMSTFSSVQNFVSCVKSEIQTINYVLLNAGLMHIEFELGQEGYEETLQVNVLSTALLALLLLPWVKEAGKGTGHLGIVTSGTHRSVPIDTEGFPKEDVLKFFSEKEHFPDGRGMYAISKLFAQYVAFEVAKLTIGPDGKPKVIVNPMCPGMVYSSLGRQYVKRNFLWNYIVRVLAKPTEGGARSLVLATLTTENGKYYTDYQTDEEYKVAAKKTVFGPEGQKMQTEVWKEILAVLTEKVPEVKQIVG